MTVRVLGVGIGLFVVIAIWIFAVVSCIISHRTHKNFGTVVVAVATLVTLILVLIPRDTEVPKKAVFKLYDQLFVWRTSLVILLGLSAVTGFVFFVITHLMQARHTQPVKRWPL